jgi:hypothetical protein
MAEPILNDYLGLIRPELDRQAQLLKKAVARIESEEAVRGISGNLVARVLDQIDEVFDDSAKVTFRALRRVSDTTRLDPDDLFQLTVQSLENFVLAIKAVGNPEKLKRIVAPAMVDDRFAALDQRLTLMARQYKVGLLSDERPEAPPSPSQWDNPSFDDAAAQIASWRQTRNNPALSTGGAVEPVPIPLDSFPRVTPQPNLARTAGRNWIPFRRSPTSLASTKMRRSTSSRNGFYQISRIPLNRRRGMTASFNTFGVARTMRATR